MEKKTSDVRRVSLPTASDGDEQFPFHGVFRDVHSLLARDKLYKAQARIADDDWAAADGLLKEALTLAADEHDVTNLNIIRQEVEMYHARAIPEGTKAADDIDWESVSEREVCMYFEKFDALPQSIFLLRSNKNDRVIVGRRILSHQFVNNKIRELHCSHVTASMILGKLVDQRLREDGIALYYKGLSDNEKLYFMDQILESGLTEYELTFPFPALVHSDKQEIQSPEGGWEIDEKLALSLGEGEVIIREYSTRFLTSIGREDIILFDCACSTGQFLATMKTAVPNSYTIGSDLSEQMAEYAAKRVDEIHCANAMEPPVPAGSVDVVFVRFINSEVVKTEIVSSFLKPLTECLKVGGRMVILGHTPVLTSSSEIKMVVPNLEIVQCIGGAKEWNGIFQFYVCKRI